jgi:hypothetical protein
MNISLTRTQWREVLRAVHYGIEYQETYVHATKGTEYESEARELLESMRGIQEILKERVKKHQQLPAKLSLTRESK